MATRLPEVCPDARSAGPESPAHLGQCPGVVHLAARGRPTGQVDPTHSRHLQQLFGELDGRRDALRSRISGGQDAVPGIRPGGPGW